MLTNIRCFAASKLTDRIPGRWFSIAVGNSKANLNNFNVTREQSLLNRVIQHFATSLFVRKSTKIRFYNDSFHRQQFQFEISLLAAGHCNGLRFYRLKPKCFYLICAPICGTRAALIFQQIIWSFISIFVGSVQKCFLEYRCFHYSSSYYFSLLQQAERSQ